MNPYQDILNILDESDAEYELLEHEPVFTSHIYQVEPGNRGSILQII